MRGKIIWAALAAVLALAAWALMTPSGETGRVGVNQRVENQVTTAAAGQTDWRPSVVGADVSFGDRIATAAASRLEVSLLDRSTLTVGANARIDVDRFVYDPERGVAGVAVSVLRGVFRFASDNRGAQPEPIAFRTPGSAIGIRGTLIEGVVGPEAVAFLAGVPGAPDLSAEADSAAVIILRQGAIGVAVSGQSVILDRPVQMVALTRTRLYSPFDVSGETTRRFEALLPTRPGAVGPPPAAPPAVSPSGDTPPAAAPPPATGPVDKPEAPPPPSTARPPVREPPAPDPAVRPPLTRAPPTAAATNPAASAPAAVAPASSTLRQPLSTTAPPTRAAPVGAPLRQPVQPPPGQQ
ncbi:MAG: FecR family protein [Alphaproteobacteria bacterium]|uniref:FecR domain-containing protein n=1 Tax=Brevundimonas sp. TaxID=1871086 RepID=UPI0017A0337A|nr:FecR domain-containing protein [Brevundimonas sp.]MBA3048452.1 FecR domain-containing protein [Brevundimonas sp.]MBU3972010.1 FecR family protein [Alphaproteobacteria bacterium]MBU3973273.1 FecR family protein [Alphaproteobacteria bacterium]MBU4136205.1 FecR family protein [Alphaproteobacteria bacterium]